MQSYHILMSDSLYGRSNQNPPVCTKKTHKTGFYFFYGFLAIKRGGVEVLIHSALYFIDCRLVLVFEPTRALLFIIV